MAAAPLTGSTVRCLKTSADLPVGMSTAHSRR